MYRVVKFKDNNNDKQWCIEKYDSFIDEQPFIICKGYSTREQAEHKLFSILYDEQYETIGEWVGDLADFQIHYDIDE